MEIFEPKPWVNPFGKMSNFRLFKLLFLQPKKAFFHCRISEKTFSQPLLPKKKKLEKYLFLDQNHWLTLLEKCQFFDFLNFFFYTLERRFFVLEYRKRYFHGLYCLKEKVVKMDIFGPKPQVNPFGKISSFGLF